MVLCILVNMIARQISDKDLVYRFGLMVQNTQASGTKARHMPSVDSSWRTVTSTKVNGKKTRLTDQASITMQTEQSTKEIGSMTNSKVLAKKSGLIRAVTQVNIKMERRMRRESSLGQTELHMKVNG